MKIRNCFASAQLRITSLRKYPNDPKAYLGRWICTMDYPKFIVSNQKEESNIQRVNLGLRCLPKYAFVGYMQATKIWASITNALHVDDNFCAILIFGENNIHNIYSLQVSLKVSMNITTNAFTRSSNIAIMSTVVLGIDIKWIIMNR